MALKRKVYLSDEQYNTLKSTGSITVGDKTVLFSEDDDYVTPDNTDAKLVALKNDLLAIINAKTELSLQIVDTLPEATADDTNTLTIYLLRNTDAVGQNIFDEYIVVNGAWEKIGDTTLHANCATKEELENYYEPLSYVDEVGGGFVKVSAEDADKYYVGMHVNFSDSNGCLVVKHMTEVYASGNFIISDIIYGTSFTQLLFDTPLSLSGFGIGQGSGVYRALPLHIMRSLQFMEARIQELETK